MKEIGTLGEKLVGRWLELQNYKLLQQNWRCRWGEIDIVAQHKANKTVAFVEVKTRSNNNWDEGGLFAVDFTKQEKIIKTASLFLAKHPQWAELPCRFDVALVSYIAQPHKIPLPIKPRDTKKKEAEINFKDIIAIEIGQPVNVGDYKLTIKNYLQSAFDS